ncbi:MAG TPA: hypothetical protein VHV83_06415 [Armatimonadota bacterium]|nr:hypothetical protein [Armatimonadota bacterium]
MTFFIKQSWLAILVISGRIGFMEKFNRWLVTGIVLPLFCVTLALVMGCNDTSESNVTVESTTPTTTTPTVPTTPVVTMPSVPAAPSIVVTPGQLKNVITWASVSGATSYKLYFKTSPGVTTADTSISDVSSPYTHTGLTSGQAYYYMMVATNSVGDGAASAEASGTPTADVPAVTAVGVHSALSVDVTFDDSMGAGVTTAANYTISGTGKGTLANNPDSVALVLGNKYRLTWNTGEMRNGGSITITVAGVQNSLGSAIVAGNNDSGTHVGGAIGTAPAVTGLANDSTPAKSKTWNWGCNEASCTYRWVIDKISNTSPSNAYGATVSDSQAIGNGTYYIHVQAKDAAGNESAVVHVSAIIDNTVPTATITPVDGATLIPSTSIVITFSESMNTGSLVVTGTGAPGSVTKTWSTTTVANDTVTLTGDWVDGSSRTIIINAADAAANAIVQITKTYKIFDAIYVSNTDGLDSNVGTHDAPKKTISAGITAASANGLEVRVAKGTYSEASSLSVPFGIQIKGGYAESDYPNSWNTARDLSMNATVIQTTSNSNGTSTSPNSTVTVASSGALDGFTVEGPGAGQYTAGVHASAGGGNVSNYTISHCYISGGAGSAVSSGIYADASFAANISSNTITAGSGVGEQYGVHVDAARSGSVISNNTVTASGGASRSKVVALYTYGASDVSISGNTLTGGTATESYGILCDASGYGSYTGTISGNTINGGAGTTSYGTYVKLIKSSGAAFKFKNNVVYGGSGSQTFGLEYDGDSNDSKTILPLIYNNKIHGGSATNQAYGIYALYTVASVYNNYIFGGTGPTTYGIYTAGGSYAPDVLNNTVNGGNATTTATAFYSCGSVGKVQNNIFFTSGGSTRYCLNYTSNVGTSSYNVFKACPTAYLFYFANYTTLVGVTGQIGGAGTFYEHTGANSAANLVNEADPDATWSNNDYSLANTSGSNIKTGGLDGNANSFDFTTDIAGTTRTPVGATGWSLGAFEQDL